MKDWRAAGKDWIQILCRDGITELSTVLCHSVWLTIDCISAIFFLECPTCGNRACTWWNTHETRPQNVVGTERRDVAIFLAWYVESFYNKRNLDTTIRESLSSSAWQSVDIVVFVGRLFFYASHGDLSLQPIKRSLKSHLKSKIRQIVPRRDLIWSLERLAKK